MDQGSTAERQALGQRLQDARTRKGWTQIQLSDAAGVARGYVSSLEQGRRDQPGAFLLVRLADALDVDPTWLLTGRGAAPGEEDGAMARLLTAVDQVVRRKEELLEGPAINEETIDRLLGAINLLARQKREWQGQAGGGVTSSVGKREPLT